MCNVEICISIPEKIINILENKDLDIDLLYETVKLMKLKNRKKWRRIKMDPQKKYFVIGDIHADTISLENILKFIYSSYFPSEVNIIFLGDYVDRGQNDLGVLSMIFSLYKEFPDNIFLMRGNHELYDENTLEPLFEPHDFYDSYIDVLKKYHIDEILLKDLFGTKP